MRILMLNYEFPPLGGGAGPVAKDIAEGLVKKGHKIDLVTMHYKGLKFNENINGVNVYRVKCLRKKKETCETLEMLSFVLKAIPFTLKLTKKKKYDIIHSHFVIPTSIIAYVLKKLRGLDYIISVHGSDIPGYNPDRFGIEHKFTKPLLKLLIKNSRITIPLSNYLKSLIEKNVTNKYNLEVIPNGIDINRFNLNKEKKNWILMTGRLLPRKGFQYVLEALKDIKAKNWEVHIAGDGPYREELEKLAKCLDIKIIFHGWLDNNSLEFKELYEKSKIFCLPSLNENSSISLLEAMLSEMAIITSNVTGCPETIGDAGFLVKPENIQNIKIRLKELIDNPKKIKEYGMKAKKRIIQNFNWDRIINRYENIFRPIKSCGK